MATGKHDDPPTEATLERMLTEVGPLLRRRAAVGAPDPAFVTRLRARLLKTGTAPVHAFAHFPRGHPTRMARGRGAVRAGLVNDQPATSPLGPPRSPRHASEGEKTRRTRARGRARKPRGPRRSQWRRLRLALDVSVTTNARALAVRAWRWRRVVAGIALAVALLALLAVAAVALVWLDLAVAALVAVALIAVLAGRWRH